MLQKVFGQRGLAIGLAATALTGLGVLPACSTEAFCFAKCDTVQIGLNDGGPDSSTGSGGTGTIDLDSGSAATGALSFGGSDGGFDDAGPSCQNIDLQTDLHNCGVCGNVCVIAGASAQCVAGACQIDHCVIGRYDIDGDVANGCEYACTPSTDLVEVCNQRDDNCDGRVDEGFDLTTDIDNCGMCGHSCSLYSATAECKLAGTPPTATCSVQACTANFWDLNGIPDDGCEYSCTVTQGGIELCDGIDNDCNGKIDDDNPQSGMACDDYCPNGLCQGECTSGTTLCLAGASVCIPGAGPTLEICDGKDNDCDGTADNGFDLTNDSHNCGVCGNDCTSAFPHGIGSCVNSMCALLVCNDGYRDYNPATPGCEHCEVYPTRDESCNGLDDDCDGIRDNPTLINASRPPTNAICNNRANTPCASVQVQCLGTGGWGCIYSSDVELDTNGKVRFTETLCDALDGNCDGNVDEAFANLNTNCDDGNTGVCRSTGQIKCDPNDASQTFCKITAPGIPAGSELCNGLDDDCDGMVDEGTEDMLRITRGGLDFFVDRFEASRPDATAVSKGLNESHVCSNARVLPWASASYSEAKLACEGSGRRLCTAAELLAACQGAALQTFPYAGAYDAQACRGLDAMPPGIDAGVPADPNGPAPTGYLTQCVSPDGIYDLSGNVNEWTSTVVGNTGAPLNLPIQSLQGGSYLSPSNGLACAFDLDRISTNAVLPSLGFRCCKDP
jgi:Sulfatase-modifying factor enzyme 1/Putative metal-binding motif